MDHFTIQATEKYSAAMYYKKCAEQWKTRSAVVDLADQSRIQQVQALKMFSWRSRT